MRLSPRPTSLALAALIAAWLLLWLTWPGERKLSAASRRVRPEEAVQVATPSEIAIESPSAHEESAVASREAVATKAAAIPEEAQKKKADVAFVRVLVRSKDDGTPLAGLGIVHEVRKDTFASRAIEWSTTTDAKGHAELEVEPDKPLLITVQGNGDFLQDRELAPLDAGQSVEVLFEFPTREDVHLHGQLVAAESGSPLAGTVTVLRGSHSGRVLATSADGQFELNGCSWESSIARAEAECRAMEMIVVAAGHESPEQPLVVRLAMGATVEFTLHDRFGAAIPSAWIQLRAPRVRLQHSFLRLLDSGYGDELFWQARTDSEGHATIAQIVPSAPLAVTVIQGGEWHRELESIRLNPGESRSIDLVVGGVSKIVGRLRDEHGIGIPLRDVWLMPARSGSRGLFLPWDQPLHSMLTGTDGRFQFDGIAAGRWWIGPAPEHESDVPPLAEFVTVTDDAPELIVVVQVQRGVHIRGSVLDARGIPAPSCVVRVSMIDGEGEWHVGADDAGCFEAGPLPGGRWRLCAFGLGGVHASSLPVEVDAGTSDVLLRLRFGGEISGSVLGVAGVLPNEYELGWGRVDRPNDETLGWRSRVFMDGTFCLDELLPATYVLVARSRHGAIGVRNGVVVRPGERRDIGTIQLSDGAVLHLTHGGDAKSVPFRICFDGVPIDCGSLESGEVKTVLVPPGSVQVRWGAIGAAAEDVETISVSAGEDRELLLSDS
jgi:hypothetical protein